MSKKNKIPFTVKKDGEDVELAVIKPSPAVWQEATRVFNQTWSKSLKDGLLLREAIEPYLKEQGLWDDEKEAQLQDFVKQISALEKKLSAGKMKKSEGREISLKLWDLRNEMRDLISRKTLIENNSVQSQAENARFNYLVSTCTVYNETGDKVFSSLEDYLEQDEEWAFAAGSQMSNLLYNLDPDYEKNLPENKFLKKFGYVNEDLSLVDEQGRTVTRDGKLVDADGYYVNQEGERVTVNGEKISDLNVETAEFYE